MTNIKFTITKDSYSLIINGHTNFANSGKDIVCAAVSMLTFTLIDALINEEAKGNIRAKSIAYSEGNAKIKVEAKPKAKDRVNTIIETIVGGYRLLSQKYSSNVNLTEFYEQNTFKEDVCY